MRRGVLIGRCEAFCSTEESRDADPDQLVDLLELWEVIVLPRRLALCALDVDLDAAFLNVY